METFSVLLALCAGNSPVTGEFPAQRPETRSFDVFFDLRLNKRMNEQSRRQLFETPSRPLWHHCHDIWGRVCHKQVSRVGTGEYISQYLWDVITCLCPWCLLLAHNSSYARIYSMFCFSSHTTVTSHWNHQLYCLFNRLFRCTSNKTSKLRVTGLCEGNPQVTGWFPSQNGSIWRRHLDILHHTPATRAPISIMN